MPPRNVALAGVFLVGWTFPRNANKRPSIPIAYSILGMQKNDPSTLKHAHTRKLPLLVVSLGKAITAKPQQCVVSSCKRQSCGLLLLILYSYTEQFARYGRKSQDRTLGYMQGYLFVFNELTFIFGNGHFTSFKHNQKSIINRQNTFHDIRLNKRITERQRMGVKQ